MEMDLRGMRPDDVPDILRLQVAAYPATLHEQPAFFLNRLALSARTCWVARAKGNGSLQGYLVAYPWNNGLPPELGAPLPTLPRPAACWFLHDCAVHPDSQGRGVGRRLYQAASAQARQLGLAQARLVALAEAAAYWRKLGYAELPTPPRGLADKLRAYGPGACYLERPLD